eukprot:CAMPEP_0119484896 /NCGR_PEP_ID=MMETSP1344-20130328/11776_1 /TAXON_ID=236787 /ORGANISM="Florenciella parvula, Strain CCMP2471" /LENGTH=113 /DNA_ID=CAMNT_0007519523 /DNA_START=378 /DNA_END=716 /DNA_ORIENTATION=-
MAREGRGGVKADVPGVRGVRGVRTERTERSFNGRMVEGVECSVEVICTVRHSVTVNLITAYILPIEPAPAVAESRRKARRTSTCVGVGVGAGAGVGVGTAGSLRDGDQSKPNG